MRSTSLRCPTNGKRSRLTVASFVALLGAFLIAGASPLRAQQAIQVFLSAVDNDGKPITDLKAEDVAVQTDGTECKTTKYEEIDWAVKIQLLVDNGPDRTYGLS